MGWPETATLEIFDWERRQWQTLPVSDVSIAVESPQRYVASNGRLKLRLAHDNGVNSGMGCLYVDAELSGELP
jgi:hypothetical protein